ncbi:MAG: rod shape-determining protein MreC [Oscillospiraceae bacterium]|nr:rod shape-determining protein MreC [Oscillospiraceae bacterium]
MKKGKFIAAVVTAGVLLCIVITHFTGSNPIANAVKTVFAPVENGFAYIADKVSGTVRFLWEMDSYKDENEELIRQINELNRETRDASQLREGNERLQELLELKNNMDGYSTVAASVIAYSKNNWYDTIEINKGLMHGLDVGNAVITPDGVVGKITDIGLNWATVSTLLNPDNAMGVRIGRTGDAAVVEGDEELYSQNYCKMTFIDKDAGIIIGDLLETSGSGGIYPAGLFVGAIREIDSDNTGMLNYATVEPSVDFSRLYEVLVINGVSQ